MFGSKYVKIKKEELNAIVEALKNCQQRKEENVTIIFNEINTDGLEAKLENSELKNRELEKELKTYKLLLKDLLKATDAIVPTVDLQKLDINV